MKNLRNILGYCYWRSYQQEKIRIYPGLFGFIITLETHEPRKFNKQTERNTEQLVQLACVRPVTKERRRLLIISTKEV